MPAIGAMPCPGPPKVGCAGAYSGSAKPDTQPKFSSGGKYIEGVTIEMRIDDHKESRLGSSSYKLDYG